MSWNPPPLAEQSGQIVEYIVNVTHAGTLVTVQYTTPLTNINITSLEPYTTYICVVAAGTAVGPGPFSHLFFIRTQEAGNKILELYKYIGNPVFNFLLQFLVPLLSMPVVFLEDQTPSILHGTRLYWNTRMERLTGIVSMSQRLKLGPCFSI